MSMPQFPQTPNLNFENAISQILVSIAMEELALSHILNAEGEKLQFAFGSVGDDCSEGTFLLFLVFRAHGKGTCVFTALL